MMMWVWAVVLGCAPDYRVRLGEEETKPVEQPDEGETDDFGGTPDWNDCPGGYLGHYYNLTAEHEDFDQAVWEEPPHDPDLRDWWDEERLVLERFDASLEMGTYWWPVDEGVGADPSYFTARWTAWLRVNEDGPVTVALGAGSDVWVLVDGTTKADLHAEDEFAYEEQVMELQAGQYPLEVRFAHRHGVSGLRMRFIGENVAVCYPDFEE